MIEQSADEEKLSERIASYPKILESTGPDGIIPANFQNEARFSNMKIELIRNVLYESGTSSNLIEWIDMMLINGNTNSSLEELLIRKVRKTVNKCVAQGGVLSFLL